MCSLSLDLASFKKEGTFVFIEVESFSSNPAIFSKARAASKAFLANIPP